MGGPQNAVVGDNFGMDLPQMQVDAKQLDEEKKAARFSKTAEFQKLKDHLELRIKHYQTFLPDGREIAGEPQNIAQNWIVANTIIAEFKAVIDAYEQAGKAVEDNG